MAKPITENWRHRRAALDLTSDEAAKRLRIAGGSLRGIECGSQPVSLRLAHRAARLYGCDVFDLITDGTVPDEPPSKEQDQEANTGPGREGGNKGRGGKDPKGPKRLKDAAA